MSGKKRKLMSARNICIITISVIIAIVGIVLSFIFDLYGYLGTIGGIVINALVFFGAFGALEIDDWTIWIKRLIIKKYEGKKGYLILKIYNQKLEKLWIRIQFYPLTYYVTNDQVVVWSLRLRDDQSLNCTINPLTNGITITDAYGKPYKCGKEQYTKNNERLDVKLDSFNVYLAEYFTHGCTIASLNPDSLTIEIEE